MGRLLVILFGVIVLSTLTVLDYYIERKAHPDAPYGFRDHLSARIGAVTGTTEKTAALADEDTQPKEKLEINAPRATDGPLSAEGCSDRAGSKFCANSTN